MGKIRGEVYSPRIPLVNVGVGPGLTGGRVWGDTRCPGTCISVLAICRGGQGADGAGLSCPGSSVVAEAINLLAVTENDRRYIREEEIECIFR